MLSATARASLNAASWASIEGLPGSSAEAKCDQRPTTVTRPASSASLAAASSPGQSAGAAPPRLSPVSAFRWTRAGRPATAAAAASRRTRSADPADRSTSAAMAAAWSCSGTAIRHRIGSSRPAWRSSSASATCTTPSQSAPPAIAARAAGTAPWPYPLALTTAITAAGAT